MCVCVCVCARVRAGFCEGLSWIEDCYFLNWKGMSNMLGGGGGGNLWKKTFSFFPVRTFSNDESL